MRHLVVNLCIKLKYFFLLSIGQPVQAVQGANVQSNMPGGGGGGGLGVGISNDGLSSSFNPANPLAGVYSPKTSHLSIVQQQLEQVHKRCNF